MPRPRTPNFLRFILTGAVIGFVIGALIAGTGVLEDPAGGNPNYNYGAGDGIGIIGMLGAGLFAIVAAVLAVLLDRRANS